MGTIRAGGLASGLDTSAIIDTLVTSAKEPINRLNNQYHILDLTKTLFKDISSDATGLKNATFNLKLESTFKSKTAISSNPTVASFTATTDAVPGTHVVDVIQTAKNSTMRSLFTTAVMYNSGAGVTNLSRGDGPVYNQLEGMYTNTVTNYGSRSVLTSEFKAYAGTMFSKSSSTTEITLPELFANGNGNLANTFGSTPETLQFNIKINNQPVTLDAITLSNTGDTVPGIHYNTQNVTDINSLMSLLDEALNDQINAEMGTVKQQYVSVGADFDHTAGKWYVAVYSTGENTVELVDAGGTLATDLGLATATDINHTSTNTIHKYISANNMANLENKLTSVNQSVIFGIQLMIDPGALTEGVFEIIQDATMNVRKASATTTIGAATTLTSSDLSSALSASGLNSTLLAGLAGKITINGVEITIPDSSKSAVDIMGIINAAGAGVTMSFDDSTGKFSLTSNITGNTTMTLGSTSDTSTFFELFNLSASAGATTSPGTSSGSLNTTTALNSSSTGFTNMPDSGIITINGVPIYIDASKDSIDDMIKKINNSGAGVTLTYDSAQDKFIITSNSTERITFGSPNDTCNMLFVMGFSYDIAPDEPLALGTAGQNAIIKVDDQTYIRDTNIIDDILTGVTIKATSVGITTLDISVDTDKSVDALATFIASYNSLMTKLKPGTISKDDRNQYMDALTQEEVEGMTEKEYAEYMEKYDALHTQDIILKSSELRSVSKSLRAYVMNSIPNINCSFTDLSQLGIEIAGAGDITITQKGLLVADSTDIEVIRQAILDNSTLMNNLANNSEEVYKFFGEYEEGKDANGNTIVITESWANRYDNMLTGLLSIDGAIGIKTRTDSALDKQMQRIQTQIESQTRRAESYLERLWKQFTYMETRIAQLQSQSQYLAQITGATASE